MACFDLETSQSMKHQYSIFRYCQLLKQLQIRTKEKIKKYDLKKNKIKSRTDLKSINILIVEAGIVCNH